MTDQEINQAIAESLGWEFIPCHDDGFGRATGESWMDPDGNIRSFPDYCNDLNAMHEAENTLAKTLGFWKPGGYGAYRTALSMRVANPISAKAKDRAIAFVVSLGKWRDE